MRLTPDTNQTVYQRNAQKWHRQRAVDLGERAWLDQLALPDHSRVLDLGCGSGKPLADYFLTQGAELVGVDFAPAMIELARQHYPDADWIVADMTALPDLGVFDAIVSWDGFFHLSPDQQRASLPRILAMLKPQGRLLLTVGPGAGEVDGRVDGEQVYRASLSIEEYCDFLEQAGTRLVTFCPEHEQTYGRIVLLAERPIH